MEFFVRDVNAPEVEMMQTDLGSCLVTTPELTLLDLSHRPDQGGLAEEAEAAMRALVPRCDTEVLAEIAEGQ